MPDEKVDVVQAWFDATRRGDLDAAFSRVADDCEFDNTRANGPNKGVHRGRVAIREAWSEFAAMWESLAMETDLFASGDEVAALVIIRVSGRDGIEVEARPAFVATVRNGEIAVMCFYQEHHEALEAVGLSD